MSTEQKPPVVHRWLPRGRTPCGLRIDQKPGIATNVGRTFNRGVTCPGCLSLSHAHGAKAAQQA